MKCLVDGRSVYPGKGGIGGSTLSLLQHLPRALGPDDELVLLRDSRAQPTPLAPSTPHTGPSVTDVPVENAMIDPAFEQLRLPALLDELGVDLVHGPCFMTPVAASRVARVATVHDVVFRRHPELVDPGLAAYLDRNTHLSCALADAVVTVSEFSRRELVSLYGAARPGLGLGLGLEDRIEVVPNAADERFHRLERLAPRGRPYGLYVGALEAKKNVAALLAGFDALLRRRPDLPHQLLLAGGRGGQALDVGALVARLGPARERVQVLGYVPDATLLDLYARASFFAYLSRYEGFGLPVVETLAARVPTIVSDRAALPEVVGDGALVIDPDDPEAVAGAVLTLLEDAPAREALVARGVARARTFSWPAAARRLVEVYRRALQRRDERLAAAEKKTADAPLCVSRGAAPETPETPETPERPETPQTVLHLLTEYPCPRARIHGVGRFGHGLARGQAAQGDRVLVLTNSSGGDLDDVEQDGVRVHRIAFPNPPRPSTGIGETQQWCAGVVARVLERREAFRDVDVVVGHDWLTAVAAREVARLLDRPLVVTIHDEVVGKHLGQLDAHARFVAELEALTLHDATHVVANSEYTARQAVRHHGVDPGKITAIPGGIDPTLLDVDHPEHLREVRAALAGEGEVLVVYLGRLDPEKGLGALTEAMTIVRRARGDVRLALAGAGRLEDALAARLGAQDTRLGYVKGQALGYLLRAADVVVVPSVYEPLGLVALESLAAGAAVVTTRAGGLAEIVRSGEDGLVVPPGDPAALAEAILRLAADPDLRGRLGRAGAARARRDFSWTEIARRTRQAYAQALRAWEAGARDLCAAPPVRPPLPPVSGVLLTQGAPVRAEAALRSLLGRTTYPSFELRVLDHGPESPDSAGGGGRLAPLVAELARAGAAVTLERLPGATLEAARAHALATAAHPRVLLVSDEVEVLAGSQDWLEGLVWLLDEVGAERVGPTLIDRARASRAENAQTLDGEPRRRAPDPACELVRVSPRADVGIGVGVDAWTHPVRLLRARLAAPAAPGEPRGQREAQLAASIVIVAYDGLELTRAAVEAVLAYTRAPYELVLVDNGSKDGTLHLFREARARLGGGVAVQVLELGANLGYPVGANRGVAVARGEHVVLLNNDTRVRAGWLEALLAAAASGDSGPSGPSGNGRLPVGAVTGKILNLDGSVQSAGGIEHAPDGRFEIPGQAEDRLAPTVTARREVRNAGGPCLLLTRALLERLAPDGRVFDEAFSPGYFEDSDLCLRARQAGFRLVYEPGAEVFHHGKATAHLVAREGRVDVWGRFEHNRRLFQARWAAQLQADWTAREAERAAERGEDAPRRRVLLCYHRSATTTAAYCEAALRRAHDVTTAGRGQELDPGDDVTAAALVAAAAERLGGPIDLLLVVEGETYVPRALEHAPCRTALWAIDTHLHAREADAPHLLLAPRFDRVFVAQRDDVATFTRRGLAATWLPLACDPAVHRQGALGAVGTDGPLDERDLDVVFVGHLRPFHARRRRLLERLSRRFRVTVHEGVWREDMARLFARAKVVWNCSLAGDLNMRVFEGLASGGLVVSDRVANGLETLFADREHLVLYDDASLEDVVARALADDAGRRAIAARGQALVLRHHTYGARMAQLVREVFASAPARAPAGPLALADDGAVHVTTPYGCLGDRLCFLAAAREYARRHPSQRVTTDVLPEVVAAWDDGLLTSSAAEGRRTLVSAPVGRHRVKGTSPDLTYVGTYAAGLGLAVTGALRPELPVLAPPAELAVDLATGLKAGLVPGRYVALQPLAGSAGNPPGLEALLAGLVATCRAALPDWPIVLVGRPGDVPRQLLAALRAQGVVGCEGAPQSKPEARDDAATGDVLRLSRTIQHAGLVLTPRSAGAHAAAAHGAPAFLWLPADGEDWHLDYPDWPTRRVTYSTPPGEAAAALAAFVSSLQLQAQPQPRSAPELQEASS